MTKTNADYIRATRERREQSGLVRLELWAHPDDHDQIKRYALRFQRKRAKAHPSNT